MHVLLSSSWVAQGNYLESNRDECTVSLIYAVHLKKQGSITFEYQYVDKNIFFEFFVSLFRFLNMVTLLIIHSVMEIYNRNVNILLFFSLLFFSSLLFSSRLFCSSLCGFLLYQSNTNTSVSKRLLSSALS